MFKNLFTEHPNSVGESYIQHMGVAGSFAATFAYATFACIVHAIFPFLFVKTGSQIIQELNERMINKRDQQTTADEKSLANAPSYTPMYEI